MKKFIKISLLSVVVIAVLSGFLIYNGYIWLNTPGKSEFPVRGIDVSNHRGVIKWNKVKAQGFDFAFIKATEGMDYVDKYFEDNWEMATEAEIKKGAYHFFTFGSSGIDQAKNFIDIVPKEKGTLPPVIDIEFGGNSKNVPGKEALLKELNDFISEMEKHYACKPILYVTYESYDKYLMGEFEDLDIWIRDIIKYPGLKDERQWLFWQYSNRGRVEGIEGFVDLNVFNGNMAEFEEHMTKAVMSSIRTWPASVP